jgi:DNA-binding LytR/AlgR family response regulator
MRYKKVKPTAWMANSPRNLVLRQQFALAFLDIDLSKKIVINIDEVSNLIVIVLDIVFVLIDMACHDRLPPM